MTSPAKASRLGSRRQAEAQRSRSQERLQPSGAALDVSGLPSFGFSHRSLMWWATAGLMAIEGCAFALPAVMLLYLRVHAPSWPLSTPPPALVWGTLNTLVMLTSLVPNQWTKKAAEKLDLEHTRIGLLVCLAWAAVFLGVRWLELANLNCRWDDDAYGSIVWLLMGLHTVHLLTDFVDSAVLTALLYRKPLPARRFVDVSENSEYWYFVVLAWLPIYALVYLLPQPWPWG
jgi:heme/copper-type cytochrome/quinol oxidase subunit 3